MLGLKGATTRNRGRKTNDTVKPKDIPGFSKWITSEVYIEDKIAESSIEQLALNMIENIEWINEAMYDVTSNVSILSTLPESEPLGECKNDDEVSAKEVHNLPNEKPDIKPNLYSEENFDENNNEDSEDIVLRTADNSILLLKSPRRIQNSSPIQQVRKREIEIIKNATNLVLEGPETQHNVDHVVPLDTLNIDDSFELISKDIRKSFAAKQKSTVIGSNEEVNQQDTESETRKSNTMSNPISITKNTSAKSSSVEPVTTGKKVKSPEDEIKELSRLIDGVDDNLLSENEDDLDFEIEKLDKIELYQLPRRSKIQEYKSPIKFSEMPLIEPLTLESSRKKSMRKTLDRQKINNMKTRQHEKISNQSNTTIFNENKNSDNQQRRRESRVFQLQPPPNEVFSNGDNSIDEPTIKLNRNIRKSVQAQSKNKENTVNTEEPSNTDLLSRLMQPTEASKQRIRQSTISPLKSQKTSRKASPQHSSKIIESGELVHKKPNNVGLSGADIVPSTLKILEAPSNVVDTGKSVSPIKKQVPLTRKSLKASATYDKLYVGKQLEAEVDIVSGKFYKETLGSKKMIPNKESKIPTISERPHLKSITKTNSRLNHQGGRNDMKNPDKHAENHHNTNNIGTESSVGNILPDVIPKIDFDYASEEELELEGSDSEDWTSERNILRQLKSQAKINPRSIFGPIPAVDCDKVFGKKFAPGMNIVWDSKDKLGAAEVDAYERAMGWK